MYKELDEATHMCDQIIKRFKEADEIAREGLREAIAALNTMAEELKTGHIKTDNERQIEAMELYILEHERVENIRLTHSQKNILRLKWVEKNAASLRKNNETH